MSIHLKMMLPIWDRNYRVHRRTNTNATANGFSTKNWTTNFALIFSEAWLMRSVNSSKLIQLSFDYHFLAEMTIRISFVNISSSEIQCDVRDILWREQWRQKDTPNDSGKRQITNGTATRIEEGKPKHTNDRNMIEMMRRDKWKSMTIANICALIFWWISFISFFLSLVDGTWNRTKRATDKYLFNEIVRCVSFFLLLFRALHSINCKTDRI